MEKDKNSSLKIGMLVFDEMTNLDFAAPYEIFSHFPESTCFIVAKSLKPVYCEGGLKIIPNCTFDDAPLFDLLFIPGGPGIEAVILDQLSLNFVQRQGQQAKYITSVCTGALVLGAAGLLQGYKATMHWASLDLLPLCGAFPVQERVVIDRNRFTGGGVTAGIDFGLSIAAEIYGQREAEEIQLLMEYNPQPPFNSGSPETAPAEVVASLVQGGHELKESRRKALSNADFLSPLGEKTILASVESQLELYDFEANLVEEDGLVINLNDCALNHLIEMLQYLEREPHLSGKHFHIDEVSGLVGNVPSIIFMRR